MEVLIKRVKGENKPESVWESLMGLDILGQRCGIPILNC